jgi:hypothetical protein
LCCDFATHFRYCRQDLRLPFRPTARRQNFPNKWDTTLGDNFAAIDVPFPCPLLTFDFVYPHITITKDDSDILLAMEEKGA